MVFSTPFPEKAAKSRPAAKGTIGWTMPMTSSSNGFWMKPRLSSKYFSCTFRCLFSGHFLTSRSVKIICNEGFECKHKRHFELEYMRMCWHWQGSRWTFQATRMNGQLSGSFGIKPDQMQVVNPILVLAFIPVFDRIIYPALGKCNLLKKPLQRLTVGLLFAGASFVVSGVVELFLVVSFWICIEIFELWSYFIQTKTIIYIADIRSWACEWWVHITNRQCDSRMWSEDCIIFYWWRKWRDFCKWKSNLRGNRDDGVQHYVLRFQWHMSKDIQLQS